MVLGYYYLIYFLDVSFKLLLVTILLQKKVIEIREQLRRIAQRLGIVLKSCERDMEVMWGNIFSPLLRERVG